MDAYDDAIMVDSPVCYLPCQDAAGTAVADASGAVRDATVAGGVILADSTDPAAPGILGRHVRLDGTDGHLVLAPGAWIDPSVNGMSVEGWFYIRSWADRMALFDFGSVAESAEGFAVWYYDYAAELFAQTGSGYDTAESFAAGAWTHFVVTLNASGAAAWYYNAAPIAHADSLTPPPSAAQMDALKYVGRYGYTGYPYLAASVTRLAVYDTVLSPTRVSDHYAAAGIEPEPELESDLTFSNYGYNYTGTARVFYEVPVAEPPADLAGRRVKVRRVHPTMPAPTLVNGRPT